MTNKYSEYKSLEHTIRHLYEEDPCWDGYQQIGMKKGKSGKPVPNCVPEEEIPEDKMTDAQMKKREELVKGMKKDMKSFQKKYGMRAKDVMYATATKMAMNSEEKADEK